MIEDFITSSLLFMLTTSVVLGLFYLFYLVSTLLGDQNDR